MVCRAIEAPGPTLWFTSSSTDTCIYNFTHFRAHTIYSEHDEDRQACPISRILHRRTHAEDIHRHTSSSIYTMGTNSNKPVAAVTAAAVFSFPLGFGEIKSSTRSSHLVIHCILIHMYLNTLSPWYAGSSGQGSPSLRPHPTSGK